MKYLLITLTLLSLASCQNAPNTPTTSPTPTPTATITPAPSSSPLAVKYTREDYIRIFDCTLAIQGNDRLTPANRGRIGAHNALIKNDTVWNVHKDNSPQLKVYDESVTTISLPLGCS